MNKNYRVIWSDARSAFVAVSENGKSRGKPKSSVRSALALAVGALFLAPAAYAACPSTITSIYSALTESQCYASGDNVTINPGGSVSVTNTSLAPAAIYIPTSVSFTGSISNSGTISSTMWAPMACSRRTPNSFAAAGLNSVTLPAASNEMMQSCAVAIMARVRPSSWES